MDKLSGLRIKRSRFNLSHRKIFDAGYYTLIPILYYFALPGDVVTLGANIFVRSMPMLAPLMNKNEIDVRYFEVPIRLVEPNFEKVVTGSENGVVLSQVPKCKKLVDNYSDLTSQGKGFNNDKYTFFDYLGVPTFTSDSTSNYADFPVADYVPKSYFRAWYDFYRDENYNLQAQDFEEAYQIFITQNHKRNCVPLMGTHIQKNYFTSALPWQLKGAVPTFIPNASGFVSFNNLNKAFLEATSYGTYNVEVRADNNDGFAHESRLWLRPDSGSPGEIVTRPGDYRSIYGEDGALNNTLHLDGIEFNAATLRSMFAETRIMERLARCGSRYVEYLSSNFGIAPRDDTLQRAQYLGGFRLPLVYTEIPQTAQDAQSPVGTLRGKGISSGGDTPVKKHLVKEFSVIFGLLNIRADLLYTQGIDKTMCYTDRWDFFNPSLQNLSEQTIKNYEVFYGSDGKNNEDFGFIPMYQELRKSKNIVCGDMRQNLSYWTQPIKFSTRPNLNTSFINGSSYKDSFMSPFGFTDDGTAKPFIIDCQNIVEAIRPISAFSIPGLIDHN